MDRKSEKDFKRADELPKKKKYINVDLSITDEAPSSRKERINLIMKTVLEGEEKHGGYNFHALLAKFTFVLGAKRATVKEYVRTLEDYGLVFIDDRFRIRPTEKGAAL